MTLAEIENVLVDLRKRHPHLDKELLTTLLLAAGWEGKSITDALLLFKDMKVEEKEEVSVQKPTSKEEITFYQPDGNEEGKLPVFVDNGAPFPSDAVVHHDEPAPAQVVETVSKEPNKETSVSTPAQPITPERESLIIEETKISKQSEEHELPPDLPLVPFESTPHVWPLSKYKDTFHGEVMPDKETVEILKKKEETPPVIPPAPQIIEKIVYVTPPQKELPLTIKNGDEEIAVEKTPMTRSDESLVFLAGVMLLGIILILGYMYSQGRL